MTNKSKPEGFSPSTLKPCPFCGGEASFRLNLGRVNGYPWFIVCPNCGVATEGSAFENNEYNASVWNTRTPKDLDKEDK